MGHRKYSKISLVLDQRNIKRLDGALDRTVENSKVPNEFSENKEFYLSIFSQIIDELKECKELLYFLPAWQIRSMEKSGIGEIYKRKS